MSLFTPPMNLVCSIVTTSRDRFGDWVYDSSSSVKCHFREINKSVDSKSAKDNLHTDSNDAEAIVWLPAGTNVDVGTVILFDSLYFKVNKITKGRRLSSSEVHFLKCELERTQGIS